MSLTALAMLPGRFARPDAVDGVAAELAEAAQAGRLACRVLSRALALPAVTAPPADLAPLASHADWQRAAQRVGLAAWAPALRRVVAREPRQRLMQALGADDYRAALAMPPLGVMAAAGELPEQAAVAIAHSGRALLARALAGQGGGWAEHADALFGQAAMTVPVSRVPGLDALLPVIAQGVGP